MIFKNSLVNKKNKPNTRTSNNLINKILTDEELLSKRNFETNRRIVYSVNIGGYDELPIPPQMDNCSYFLITDAVEIHSDIPWTIVRPTFNESDIKRLCLWYKTHPHILFPNADFVTWIDSNIECHSSSETY